MNDIDEIKKEIARQMGVESFSQALEKEDWKKVDPDIRKSYVEFVASRLAETMRCIDNGTSPEILEKVESSGSAKPFLILEEP